jgi:branched-chain amino acid transport system substrate-binding protein
MKRRLFLGSAALAATAARARDLAPGVTATEIRIGQTGAMSGPAAPYGVLARTALACFRALNERGGIHGRSVRLVVADDQYNATQSVEALRWLLDKEKVALMFGSFGTPTNAAQAALLNQRGIPHLFLATGADQWGDHKALPCSMGFQPSFRTEARIYVKHIIQTNPDPRIALLYQNDGFGKDYLHGVQDILGSLQAFKLARAMPYDTTDAGIEAQVQGLRASGAKYLIVAAIPKFAALALRSVQAMDWRPSIYLSLGSALVPATTEPLQGRSDLAVYSGVFAKAPGDAEWDKDPDVLRYRAFMAAQLPQENPNDPLCALAYNSAELLARVLRQAGQDLSRANILRQAENLKDVTLPLLLPGITVNTAPDDHYPVEQLQLARWTGARWQRFGDIITTSDIPWRLKG